MIKSTDHRENIMMICADDLSVSLGRFSLKNITLEIKKRKYMRYSDKQDPENPFFWNRWQVFTSRPQAPYHMTVQTFAIYLLKTGISDPYIRIMDFFLI